MKAACGLLKGCVKKRGHSAATLSYCDQTQTKARCATAVALIVTNSRLALRWQIAIKRRVVRQQIGVAHSGWATLYKRDFGSLVIGVRSAMPGVLGPRGGRPMSGVVHRGVVF